MIRRFPALLAVAVLALSACDDKGITPPDENEAVLSEIELAQLADLNAYVQMIERGADPASDEARALNQRILDRFPVREEVLEASRGMDDPVAAPPSNYDRLQWRNQSGIRATREGLMPGSGPAGQIVVPEDVGTIGAAIAAAGPGETILVRPGTYNEQIFVTDLQGLTILGVGAEIYGSMVLGGSDLTVAGFTVTGGFPQGILLADGTGNVALTNTVYGAYDALPFFSTVDGLLAGNRVYGAEFGISVLGDAGTGADRNLIVANVAENSMYGFDIEGIGAPVLETVMLGNAVLDNTYGIWVDDTENTSVLFNLGNCNDVFLMDEDGNTTTAGNWVGCGSF